MNANWAGLSAVSASPGLRRVLIAYGLYGMVEFSIWTAVILYGYDEGGASLAGAVAVVQLLPASLLAPMLASVGDRIPRGTALVLAHSFVAITTLLTLVALIAEAPVPVVIAASTTATVAVAVVRPIHFAALPQLATSAQQLVSANSMSSMLDGITLFAGPAVAGFAVALSGPWLVFLGATVTAAVAALLCMRLRLDAGVDPEELEEHTGWRAAVRGLSTLRGDWAAVALLLVMTVTFVLGGAADVLGAPYAVEVLGMDAAAAGLVIGASGIGGLIGAVVASSVSTSRRLAPVIIAGGCMEGLAFAAVAIIGHLAPAMVFLIISGIGGAILLVSGRTLLQRTTDDVVLARVFAVQEATSLLGLALGAALAPAFVSWTSAGVAFAIFGIGAVALSLGAYLLVRHLDSRADLRPQAIALLRQVPAFEGLPPYELERMAARATWQPVVPGEVVISQGEPGARFYAVESGEFAVVIDEVTRPTVLGPGSSFGEIALLHNVPRTASIIAKEPGRLLVVSASVFLAAVTGSAVGRERATESAQAMLDGDERTGE